MNYAVCCVPVSPVRAEPSHKSEMVTQQLFGEKSVPVDTARDNWVKIKMKYDGYEGWCQASHLTELDEELYLKTDTDLTGGWINEIDYNGHHMFVPLGASLSAFKNGKAFWRRNSVSFDGEVWRPETVKLTPKLVRTIAYKFLNTSYLWGGKSVFGIDCSGFAQLTFKLLNRKLPRDAWMQAGEGEPVSFLQEVKTGDLAFFDNEEGRINHVGILLNEHEIIHSSGKVRIDRIDSQGIMNLDTKQRTHNLRLIKRYF